MSIQSEINRIQKNVQDTISAIQQTGVAVPEGANSDNLPDLAAALANEKQDKLTGQQGQVVGFNASGEAVAQAAPQAGITQSQADARYIPQNLSSDGEIYWQRSGDDVLIIVGMTATGLFKISAGTASLEFDGNGEQINVSNPLNYKNVANKGYVDNAVNGKVAKYRTVTLTAAGWSNNQQTVTVNGVSATEIAQLIQPMPAVASQQAYMAAGIYCSGQAANSLTFTCSTVPTQDITVYVTIQEVQS